MLVKQVRSPSKLTVIREVEEYRCSFDSKLRLRDNLTHNCHSNPRANTNLYAQEFLDRDTNDIVREYRSNPFFRAKLSYALASHSKRGGKLSQTDGICEIDSPISTHKHASCSSNELIEAKIAQIVLKLSV